MKPFIRGIVLLVVSAQIPFFSGSLLASPGPVAYWPFNEASGTVLTDMSGNSNTGCLNTATRAVGVSGNALSTNGTGDYAYINNSATLNISSQLTIECWANLRQINPVSGAGQNFIRKERSYTIGVGSNGRVGFWVCGPDGWKGSWTLSQQMIQPNQWYHIAGVWNGQVLKVYINGVEDPNTIPANITIPPNTRNAYIGWFYESAYEGVNGTLDELKIFDYALPADSIYSHYKAITPPTPPHDTVPNPDSVSNMLVAYWPFNEESGTVLTDMSGNGNTGCLNTATRAVGVDCNNALSTNGTGDYAYINNSATLNISSQLTIECWANLRQINPVSGEGQNFIRKERSYTIGVGSNGRVGFWVCGPDGWKGSWTLSQQMIQPNQWYHIAGVWNGQVLKVYINGVEDPNTIPANITIPPNTRNAYIGWFYESAYEGVNGTLDELKIYNYALTADQILAHSKTPERCVPELVPHQPRHDCDRKPHLNWHPVCGNNGYKIQICSTPDFAAPIVDDAPADTSYSPASDLPLGTIHWRVSTESESNRYSVPDTFVIEPPTGVTGLNSENILSTTMSIVQLRRGMAVNYSLEKQGTISVDIMSLAGNRVATVYKGTAAAGKHSLVWDKKDRQGKLIPAGSYIVLCRINERAVLTKKIILLQ
jgi:hypothetical protein